MKHNYTLSLIIVVILIMTKIATSQVPPHSFFALSLTNAGETITDTMGVAVGSSRCTNSVDTSLGELVLPVYAPCTCVDAIIHQASGCTGYDGGFHVNYWPGSTTEHSSARFTIAYQLANDTDSSYTFSWDTTGFSRMFDTLTLRGSSHEGPLANVNMLEQTSITVLTTDPAYNTNPINIFMGAKPILVLDAPDQKNNLPKNFALRQNYPNPFNPTTHISFDMPKTAAINVTVYDVLGRNVSTLINSVQQTGQHTVEWNGKNYAGMPVPSGTYFVRMVSGEFVQVQKILLMK